MLFLQNDGFGFFGLSKIEKCFVVHKKENRACAYMKNGFEFAENVFVYCDFRKRKEKILFF